MKYRLLLIVVGLLAGIQTTLSAALEIPPGVKTLTVNGYPMAYRERGSGETVVLVHGAGSDYRVWNGLLELPPTGVRLIAISLRHYYPERWDGKGGQFSARRHAEDLAAFIEALGVGSVHLVAHSLGGVFAVRAVQARPALVKKLVLMEGAFSSLLPPAKPGEGRLSIPAIQKSVAARFEQGDIDGGLEMWVDRDSSGTWKRRSDAERQMSHDNAWTLIMPLGPEGDLTCADLAGLKMPVLLMQGQRTSPRLASIVEATQKCLPSAQNVVIPEAGHSMQRMNPAGVQSELVKFLRNDDPSG